MVYWILFFKKKENTASLREKVMFIPKGASGLTQLGGTIALGWRERNPSG